MGKFNDLTGLIFGRLRVVGIVPESRGTKNIKWDCVCECGNHKDVSGCHLKSGHTSSCGCLHKEKFTTSRITHGHTSGRNISPTYQTWSSMLKRCNNPAATNYDRYGGRGIKVCDRWHEFESFLNDMGERPSTDYEIDRIDNNGNYEPGNCRWVTAKRNSRNRRSTRIIDTPNGRMSVKDASELSGINYGTLLSRVISGWPTDKLFEPANSNIKNAKTS